MDCIESQFEAVGKAKLVKNVVQMIFNRLLTDKELLADLAIATALRDQLTISFSRSLSSGCSRR
jgi:hypothetical protein